MLSGTRQIDNLRLSLRVVAARSGFKLTTFRMEDESPNLYTTGGSTEPFLITHTACRYHLNKDVVE